MTCSLAGALSGAPAPTDIGEMMKETELAWAAGFFDGEGTTCCVFNNEYRSIRLSVPQNEVEPLERFQRAIGGLGVIYPPYTGSTYSLQITGWPGVKRVIDLLFPYWCDPKRTQAMTAVDRYLNWFNKCDRKICGTAKKIHCRDSLNAGLHTHCRRGHEYTEESVRLDSDGNRDCISCCEIRKEERKNESS